MRLSFIGAGLAAVMIVAGPGWAKAVKPRLPDWSGTWIPDVAVQEKERRQNPPPWTPAAGKRIDAQVSDIIAGRPQELFVNCLPEGMPTWMLISHQAMEILFTPGRVTMLGESDGNAMRRIYTDGRGHPADPDPTFHGHSIGRWEGRTLVVDTVAILPEAYLAVNEGVGIPANGDVHVVERLHLTGPDVLTDDIEITAPHILTAPWRTTRAYDRERGPGSEIAEGICRQGDFAEARDAQGSAVFIPVQQKAGNHLAGNPE